MENLDPGKVRKRPLKQICVLTTAESRAKVWLVKSTQAHPSPITSAVVRSNVAVLLLSTHCLLLLLLFCGDYMYSPCFVKQNLVSLLFWGEERSGYFTYLPVGVICLLVLLVLKVGLIVALPCHNFLLFREALKH